MDVSFRQEAIEDGSDFLQKQGAFCQERIRQSCWQAVLTRFSLEGTLNNLMRLLAVDHVLTGLDS